jgi:hypothetical protein
VARGGIHPHGDVYEVAFRIGSGEETDGAPWAIDTIVTVMPDVRRAKLIPEMQEKAEAIL